MPTKQALIDYAKKGAFDDIYTPEVCIPPIINFINYRMEFEQRYFTPKTIWECADPGVSKITSLFKKSRFNVISTDIKTGFDFLVDTPNFEFDYIVTNPPYSLKDRWLERCFSFGKPFALLLPITSLEGIKRGKLFRKYGISTIVLDKRVDFTGKGNNWFNVSWFMWNIGENNKIYFEEI